MLRGFYLENFILFKDKQTISFEENESPYIFVGQNGSGKSSVVEGIRRCLSNAASTTWSSVFDKNRADGYFVCKYDTTKCSTGQLEKLNELFSGIITKCSGGEIDGYYKFTSTVTDFFIDQYSPGKRDSPLAHEEITGENAQNIFKKLKDGESPISLVTNPSKIKTEDSKVEKLLTELEKYIVQTFPSRSIGPLQWSKSENIGEKKGQSNYEEADKRAEILRYFLDHDDEYDTNVAQEIFTYLTGHDDIKFRFDENKRIVVESSCKQTLLPGGEFALLKLPEGILEAKHFSILMSHTKWHTVILEEPDKGMHPQMVERMLANIHKYRHSKLVILCTHNPYFVNPFTITRLKIFKKISDTEDARKAHTVIISGNDVAKAQITDDQDISMKDLRLLTVVHLPVLIFAKRILFCEGDSDFLFLTALKGTIMNETDGLKNVLKFVKGSGEAKLQKVCVSLQIVKLQGWNNAQLSHKVCEKLKIDEHCFLCDKDVILNENNTIFTGGKEWLGSSFKSIQNQFKENNDVMQARKNLMKKCKLFFWRNGTIEDMAIALQLSETGKRKSTEGKTSFDQDEVNQVVIEELKAQNIQLLIKEQSQKNQEQSKELYKKSTTKLYRSKKITQENVEKSLEIFLKACNNDTDDLVHFIQFLSDMDTCK